MIFIKRNYELLCTETNHRIVLHHFSTDTFLMVTNNEELKKILYTKGTCLQIDKPDKYKTRKKVRLTLNNYPDKPIATPVFSRVAYDCYHNTITTGNIFSHYQRNGTEYLNPDASTIDHLDGNWRNNTKENLFEMTRKENDDKNTIQKRYRGIFHVAFANDGEFCRIQFAYSTSSGQVYVFRYRCIDGKRINKCLEYFIKSKSRWRIREHRGGLPCNSDYEVIRYKYFIPFIGQVKSIAPINQYELAEKMVSMPEDDFPLFDGGMPE